MQIFDKTFTDKVAPNPNPVNTVFDAKRLIGRKFPDEVVQSAIKLWPFKVLSGAVGKPIQINFGEDQQDNH
eukprot:6092291-Karenia_brevis.AAC.1